jgi:hypothetical protein
MARYRCPECRRRIRGEVRCHRCGWRSSGEGDRPLVARRPWGRVAAMLALILMVGAAGMYRLNGEAIADWYAEFALRHLPAGFSSFAPADTPGGAFQHCVSRVAKKVRDNATVETFPAYSEENTTALGDGRYAVRAVVEGVTLEGETVRRPFGCVVRFEGGRWVAEQVAVDDLSAFLPVAVLR